MSDDELIAELLDQLDGIYFFVYFEESDEFEIYEFEEVK